LHAERFARLMAADYPRPMRIQHFSIALVTASVALTFACQTTDERGKEPPPTSAVDAQPTSVAAGQFPAVADKVYADYLAFSPGNAVELGYHAFDGQVPSVAMADWEAWIGKLKAHKASLEAIAATDLDKRARLERGILLSWVDQALFDIEVRKIHTRNPIIYRLDVSSYISRPYAPADDRARAIAQVARAAPAFYAQAQANLEEVLPRTFVQTALAANKGTISFVQDDVPLAMKDASPGALKDMNDAIAVFVKALEGHVAFLEQRLENANDNYALGTDAFNQMVALNAGFPIPLDRLKAVAEADLVKNTARIEAAARAIDPDASVKEVIERVLADKPATDAVLAEATEQCADLKAHLEQNPIISIPSDEVAEVVETPPFLRYNFAFLDGAGPFEKQKLKSFYYITPPDPSWPKEQQLAYVPGKTDLLGTSIHEVWPGHFLHGLHRKKIDAKVLKSFWNYAFGEGWAHYAEWMMVTDGGYKKDDPTVQVGILVNALLRNVRFLTAIGLHTEGMTVEQAKQLFKDKAYQDEGNAMQQANRGTFDPMFLSYTLGKLMILKLRDDHRAKVGDGWTMQAFHDELLGYGSAPLALIREQMLGTANDAL
jgi:uncharacterized protein (DUF885 family)